MIFCLVPVIMVTGQEQQVKKLLSEAIYQEEVNGDLNKAVKTYQQILEQYPDSRNACAEALLHLGMCHEKLGNQEAVKTYNRLVNNYPEQKNEVAIARERLSRLKQTTAKVLATPLMPKFTKIKTPTKFSGNVILSPDGKDLALVGESDRKIWLVPLKGNLGPNLPGKPVQLNTEGIDAENSGLAWSYDRKSIAFNEFPLKGRPQNEQWNQGVFVVPSSGGKPVKVVDNFRASQLLNYRLSLSPDGKKLAFTSVENTEQHIYIQEVTGVSPKKLTDMQAREPVFSPDGKMIAFVEDKKLGRGQGELGLWIIPAEGGTPQLLAEAGKASSPVWSPDGSTIAFLDYNKNKQINFVQVTGNIKATGKVSSIDAPEGTEDVWQLAGWTPENKIGVVLNARKEYSLYTLPSQGGQAAEILHDCWAMQPRWSRDGKQIIYVTPESPGPGEAYRLTLATVSADGGSGKLLAKDVDGKIIRQLGNASGNRLSPDGKTIVTTGWTAEDSVGEMGLPSTHIWKISVDGSRSEKLTSENKSYADLCPSWSPDGNKIAFLRMKKLKENIPFGAFDLYSIYTINSSGGDLKLLVSEPEKWINSPVWSPDGKMIAYLTVGKTPPNAKYINIFNLESGMVKAVGEVSAAGATNDLAWSPDSKRIAFNDGKGKVIKVMNINDGTIKDVETNLADEISIYHLDWSSDGKQFVFGGEKGGTEEFWLMENFLPIEKLAQKNEKEKLTESEGIRIKQIWKEPLLDDLGTVSYDGRFRSYVDWGEGDVAIQDLITGEKKKLTNKASLSDTNSFALETAISKNGKLIASSWWKPHNTTDLILVNVMNPTLNVIYSKKGEELYPYIWLSDSVIVGLRLIPDQKTLQIFTFNILNRTLKVKKSFNKIYVNQLACSPDEKYIAYDFISEADGNTDINLMTANGDSDVPLISHPANDKVIGWVPGRKEFLFISDRSGTWDLWSIKLADGKPTTQPKRIYVDIGEVSPIGFTQNGSCYFGFSRRNFNTYTVPFNSETGELKEGSGKSLIGSNFWIKWSPDGQYLAYIKENAKADNLWQLIIQDLKTGEERKIANNLFLARMPCWSPDGMSILVQGSEKNKFNTENYKGGIFVVDVKTGQTREVFLLSDQKYTRPEDDSSPISDMQWSYDGKSIFYLFFKDMLVKRDLASGKEQILYENPNFERLVLNCSPDGKKLLFGIKDPAINKSRLLTMSVEGGEMKELCTPQESNSFRYAKWSPDGKYVYFSENSDGTSLWRIPAEGGTPQKIWHSKNDTDFFSISPDGKEMALGIQERTTEMRVIENLVRELERLDKLENKPK